jgi:hypothetical protein
VDHLDVVGREPMIVEHPNGALFVAGYGEPSPMLWKSVDRGATWSRVKVGDAAHGALGNSDVDLAISADGTLYFASMVFNRKTNEGTSINVGVSRDAGVTWAWGLVSNVRFDDRPWIAVGPDGTPHVVWNDGQGVCHAMSHDRGRTWTTCAKISSHGGSSHMAIGPKGDIAVRVTPLSASGNTYDAGVDVIAVSSDGGATWQMRTAPGTREWAPRIDRSVKPIRFIEPEVDRWVEPLAWDGDEALYSFWTNKAGLWLARSAERGATWTTWKVAESADVAFYPYLIARGHGELAATWFSGKGQAMRAHLARLNVKDGIAPHMLASPPFEIDVWAAGQRPTDPPTRDSAGEYLAMAFLRDGGLAMVSPIQDKAAARFGFTYWTVK